MKIARQHLELYQYRGEIRMRGFSKEQEEYLIDNMGDIQSGEIAITELNEMFNKKGDSIRSKIQRMGYANPPNSRDIRMYALYKGDNLLTIGTRKELAEYIGVKEGTISAYGTKSWRERTSEDNSRRVIRI